MNSTHLRLVGVLFLTGWLAGCGGGGERCDQDSECPPGRYCQLSTRRCVFDCVEDRECPVDFYCSLHGQCLRGCPDGSHDGGDGRCVVIGTCSTGYHDGGDGSCVPAGTCGDGFHDGGDGSCLAEGLCADGYVLGGGGMCVPPGTCGSGYHDGGDGVCVPLGSCASSYHDGGDGSCVPLGTCVPGFEDDGAGGCVSPGNCAAGYHDGGDGSCVPEGSCAAGYHDGGGDSGGCLPEGECWLGFVLESDGSCTLDPLMLQDDFEDGAIDPIWSLWRMEFQESAGGLNVVSQPRIGFDYGHDGHGRGATVVAQVGNPFWTDYRLAFEIENGPPGLFNPYGVPSCFRGSAVLFRITQARESWNEPAETAYTFNLQTTDCTDWSVRGRWSLGRSHGVWVDAPSGWSEADSQGSSSNLASGTDPDVVVDGPNLIEIEAVGERIQIWVNAQLLVDHTEQPEDYLPDQTPILFGGVGVRWGWESTGALCSVHVEQAGL